MERASSAGLSDNKRATIQQNEAEVEPINETPAVDENVDHLRKHCDEWFD